MTAEFTRGKGPIKWVSTGWLQEHLDDEGLSILDTQPSVHDYIMEHVPGALYLNEGLFKVPLNGVPVHFGPVEAVEANLRRLGLKADLPVVVYTGVGPVKMRGDGLEQSAVAYALSRFGMNHVHILDGGIDKWKGENRPLSKEYPHVVESDFQAQVHQEYYIEQEELHALLGHKHLLLVDSRPPSVYQGQFHWPKPGHIPEAINLPWTTFFDDDNPQLLRPDAEIQALIDSYGISPGKTIVCYCGTGRKATSQFLLFKWYLGFPNVRLYEGSFTDWTSRPANPTVAGVDPGQIAGSRDAS